MYQATYSSSFLHSLISYDPKMKPKWPLWKVSQARRCTLTAGVVDLVLASQQFVKVEQCNIIGGIIYDPSMIRTRFDAVYPYSDWGFQLRVPPLKLDIYQLELFVRFRRANHNEIVFDSVNFNITAPVVLLGKKYQSFSDNSWSHKDAYCSQIIQVTRPDVELLTFIAEVNTSIYDSNNNDFWNNVDKWKAENTQTSVIMRLTRRGVDGGVEPLRLLGGHEDSYRSASVSPIGSEFELLEISE